MDKKEHIKGLLYNVLMLVLILFALMLVVSFPMKCKAATPARIDTVMCNHDCVEKYIEVQSTNGKTKIYALYSDDKNNIHELIYVSKSTYEYITLCKANKMLPNLGIRLRNGQITGLVRYKKHYKVK